MKKKDTEIWICGVPLLIDNEKLESFKAEIAVCFVMAVVIFAIIIAAAVWG